MLVYKILAFVKNIHFFGLVIINFHGRIMYSCTVSEVSLLYKLHKEDCCL